MVFGITMPPVAPYQVLGTFEDFESKVPELARRVEIATTFKNGDGRLRAEETPQRLRLHKPGQRLRDVFETYGGAMVVSHTVQDLIEKMDPGRHQLLPIYIVNDSGGKSWFILNVYASIDSIDDDKSDVRQRFSSSGRNLMSIPGLDYISRDIKLKFVDGFFSDLNLWREMRYKGYLFCSDEFYRVFRERRLDGFEFKHAKED